MICFGRRRARTIETDGLSTLAVDSVAPRASRLAHRRVEMECEGRCREAARLDADPALEMGPETALSYSKGKFSCDINVVPRGGIEFSYMLLS